MLINFVLELKLSHNLKEHASVDVKSGFVLAMMLTL